MFKNWPKLGEDLNPLLVKLRGSAGEVMKGFAQMAQGATKAGALDPKTKELIAYALSISTRCDPCITYHAKAAAKLGATKEEVSEAAGVAIYMGAGPNVMYAAQALEAFEQYQEKQAEALHPAA
ncbi:MAG: carboxymuconolactone decarboxylase family protein [Pseudomonadota bacterium]